MDRAPTLRRDFVERCALDALRPRNVDTISARSGLRPRCCPHGDLGPAGACRCALEFACVARVFRYRANADTIWDRWLTHDRAAEKVAEFMSARRGGDVVGLRRPTGRRCSGFQKALAWTNSVRIICLRDLGILVLVAPRACITRRFDVDFTEIFMAPAFGPIERISSVSAVPLPLCEENRRGPRSRAARRPQGRLNKYPRLAVALPKPWPPGASVRRYAPACCRASS